MGEIRPALSVAEVAELAGVHEHTVRRAIARGALAAGKPGGQYRIRPEDFEAWCYGPPPDRPARPQRAQTQATRASSGRSLAAIDAIERGEERAA